MPWTIHQGDALETLRVMDAASFDAVLCDPPYGLSFMGKVWDHGVPSVEVWAEVLRVLKPGAFLLAFGGTRTFHRLTCAIEDAGFEIRDSITYLHGLTNPLIWCYASGFPKSHQFGCRCKETGPKTQPDHDGLPSVRRELHPEGFRNEPCPQNGCGESLLEEMCGRDAGDTVERGTEGHTESKGQADEGGLRGVREGEADESIQDRQGDEADLLQEMQRHPSRPGMGETRPQGTSGVDRSQSRQLQGEDGGREESSMEGRRDIQEEQGELSGSEVCPVPRSVHGDGPEGRLCDGASAGDGGLDGPPLDADGSGASLGSQHAEQCAEESGALAGQPEPQGRRGGAACPRCGKPMDWSGYGTALKPAWEPCIVAMKPLDGTFAENALEHGVAGINIEAGRVGDFVNTTPSGMDRLNARQAEMGYRPDAYQKGPVEPSGAKGRWPANLILDAESGAMLDAQSGTLKAGVAIRSRSGGLNCHSDQPKPPMGDMGYAGEGGASRFFYCAKASRNERDAGLGGFEARACDDWPQNLDPGANRGAAPRANHHPCLKPLDLNRYLASLILPPKRDTPRRILVPFSGSGSEMIGALLAGWDEAVGIEREADYCAIAEARLRYWTEPGAWEREMAEIVAADETFDDLPLFGCQP